MSCIFPFLVTLWIYGSLCNKINKFLLFYTNPNDIGANGPVFNYTALVLSIVLICLIISWDFWVHLVIHENPCSIF